MRTQPSPARNLPQATHVRRVFTTNAGGSFVASDLPFGIYTLQVARAEPSSIDASGGVDLWHASHLSGRLQLDIFNLTDRLNVVNVAGLLSGAALGIAVQ